MTFEEWMKEPRNQHAGFVEIQDGGYQVFSRDPDLWHLTDYVVTGAVSGPSVILTPRTGPDYRTICDKVLTVRILDTVRDHTVTELPVLFKGNWEFVRQYAKRNKLRWKHCPNLLYHGYYVAENGDCYYLT